MTEEQQHHTRNGLMAIYWHAKNIQRTHELGTMTRACADGILDQVQRIIRAHEDRDNVQLQR